MEFLISVRNNQEWTVNTNKFNNVYNQLDATITAY